MSSPAGLRERLEAVAGLPVPRHVTANDEGVARLRAIVAADFGLTAARVWRSPDCPALAWLRRVSTGTASAGEEALFAKIAAEEFFAPPVTTSAYLRAVPRVMAGP